MLPVLRSGSPVRNVSVSVLLHPEDIERTLRNDIAEGLGATPRSIPSEWSYDSRHVARWNAKEGWIEMLLRRLCHHARPASGSLSRVPAQPNRPSWMPTLSAGLMLFRRGPAGGEVEVLLVHPGGPFWASKDDAAWSIPKGECSEAEDALAAAEREFGEELGSSLPDGPRLPLGALAQSRSKRVTVWAVEGTLDPSTARSNTFEMEWPPRSGRLQQFPEIDRAEWFRIDVARSKLHRGQVPFLDLLLESLE